MSQFWFKYAHAFQLKALPDIKAEQLERALDVYHYQPCTPHMPSAIGWYSPFDDPDGNLVHSSQGCMLFSLLIEDKILPTTVVRDEVNSRIKKIEAEEDRKVRGKEKSRLRDEVTVSLLPKAFSKRQLVHAYLDPVLKILVVNTESPNKLTLFQKLFNQSLPQIKLANLSIKALNFLMSEWVMRPDMLPDTFELGNACVLQNPEKEQSVVRCQQQMMISDGILSFLNAGFKINQLRLNWREQLDFTLRANGAIQQIKFLDMLQEMREDIQVETSAEQIDADFFIMTQTFREFLQELMQLICLEEDNKQSITHKAAEESLAEGF